MISTALIASLVFVDKLGQLHCALRIQRRDLLTPSQSKFNCMIFHKSPALFIFTSSKPTLFYTNTMNRTDSRETTITSIQKEKKYFSLLSWAAVATKLRSNSANFRRLKNKLTYILLINSFVNVSTTKKCGQWLYAMPFVWMKNYV